MNTFCDCDTNVAGSIENVFKQKLDAIKWVKEEFKYAGLPDDLYGHVADFMNDSPRHCLSEINCVELSLLGASDLNPISYNAGGQIIPTSGLVAALKMYTTVSIELEDQLSILILRSTA